MKLEQQVVNLDLAKKLKELGVKQESIFYWVDLNFSGARGVDKPYPIYYGKTKDDGGGDLYAKHTYASAYTVAELGELLPNQTSLTRKDNHGAWLYPEKDGDRMIEFTEADARAKCLIYLLENGLIKQ